MNKIFKTALWALFLLCGLIINLPSNADIGPSMDINVSEYKTRNLVVLSVYELELPGNPQKPVIDNKGNFALIPAKDLDILYYVSIVKGRPVLLNATIPTGKAPVAVAISNSSRKAFVANELDDTISVINVDEENSQPETTISVGDRPYSLAFGKNGRYLYVVNRGEDTVFVVDTDNEEYPVVNKIKVGEWPNSIKISADGKSAFVVNRGGNTVTEIDLQSPSGSVLKEDVIVGTYPIDVAVSKDSNIALVTNGLDDDISIFSPVESSRVVFGKINGFKKPWGIASDYLNNIAIAVSYDDSKIHYYDLSNSGSKIVSELKHTTIEMMDKPEFITINGKTGVAFISHPKRDNLTVINFKINEEKIEIKKPQPKENKFEPAFKQNELNQEQQIIQQEEVKKENSSNSKVTYPQSPQVQQAEEVIENFDEEDEEE